MKTSTIRKRHDLFLHGSQVKYLLLTVVAAVVIITIVVIVALLFKRIIT